MMVSVSGLYIMGGLDVGLGRPLDFLSAFPVQNESIVVFCVSRGFVESYGLKK